MSPAATATAGARFRCSELSETLGEGLGGTASTVTGWLLVEQPGPWGYDALRRNRMGGATSAGLRTAAREAGLRAVLIRRPDRPHARERRVFLVHTDEGSGLLTSWTAPTVERAVDGIVSGRGQLDDRPLFLVCTNGRRDPCCAERGRAVFDAMARAAGDRVWECSHIGGDRFAANVIWMPAGVYYGRVAPDDAVSLVREARRGRILLDRYRGRTQHRMPVQAAESFLRERLGLGDVRGIEHLETRGRGDGRMEVRFGLATGREVRVAVSIEAGAPRPLTCRSSEELAPRVYRVAR